MAGVALDPLTGGPVVDQWRETNVPGIFAGGNVVHVHDLVDNVSWEAEIAGAQAARFARKGKLEKERKMILKPGRNIRYVVPQAVSTQTDVTLYARVQDVEQDVYLKVGTVFKQHLRVVKPGEMLKWNLSQSELGRVKEDVAELIVTCEGRRSNG
jgi:pyruvate/2-oxoglutarate dehydrogenase complex dihydrolipoamide dehydrogenase (E3) component